MTSGFASIASLISAKVSTSRHGVSYSSRKHRASAIDVGDEVGAGVPAIVGEGVSSFGKVALLSVYC